MQYYISIVFIIKIILIYYNSNGIIIVKHPRTIIWMGRYIRNKLLLLLILLTSIVANNAQMRVKSFRTMYVCLLLLVLVHRACRLENVYFPVFSSLKSICAAAMIMFSAWGCSIALSVQRKFALLITSLKRAPACFIHRKKLIRSSLKSCHSRRRY